jgi:regulator of cell morphogenesis and NO signaling
VWDATTTVGVVVAQRPATARIFELLKVDYCCGGASTLAAAAEKAGVEVDRLLAALAVVGGPVGSEGMRDWTKVPIPEVLDHVVATHHAFLRRELPRLEGIVTKVAQVHGARHPELAEVRSTYLGLVAELRKHMAAEEERAFPALRAALASGRGHTPEAMALFATLRADHDAAGAALHRLREITRGFECPADACTLYRQMLAGLEALEQDMHAHVHLENVVALPRTP